MFGLTSVVVRRGLATSVSTRFASTLVIAEHANGKLGDSTLNVVNAASQIGGDVTVLVAGSDSDAVSTQAAAVSGVSSVISASDSSYDHSVAENVTSLVETLQGDKSFSHIFFASTNEGKNIAPRLAANLDVSILSDVIEVNSEDTFKRPLYAGNAIATVKSIDSVKVATIRTTAFDKSDAEGGSASIDKLDGGNTSSTKWVADEVAQSDRPDLTAADIVLAGGRGMKNGENFQMLYDLADKLGGAKTAVGASRAAVDAGYVANELQIGQTGKIVAPNLYIGVGVSGAIQHLAGMKDSKTIVCINKDPEAPIFQVSDVGLEADLFKAVPEMIEKL